MTTCEVMGYLTELGIKLTKGNDGGPHVSSPPGAITPIIRRVMRRHRSEILKQLGIDPAAFPEPEPVKPEPLFQWVEIKGVHCVIFGDSKEDLDENIAQARRMNGVWAS